MTQFYFVRKDGEVIGTYTILKNAILQAQLNPGSEVFDGDGNKVYPE